MSANKRPDTINPSTRSEEGEGGMLPNMLRPQKTEFNARGNPELSLERNRDDGKGPGAQYGHAMMVGDDILRSQDASVGRDEQALRELHEKLEEDKSRGKDPALPGKSREA